MLDGNSEIGAHVRSNLWYLTCVRLLISSRAGTNRVFLPELIIHHACATLNELPSNISTMQYNKFVTRSESTGVRRARVRDPANEQHIQVSLQTLSNNGSQMATFLSNYILLFFGSYLRKDTLQLWYWYFYKNINIELNKLHIVPL